MGICMEKVLLKRIENSKIVSFDIFDTLVTRCVGKPKNVFLLMEEHLVNKFDGRYVGFAERRIASEKEARNRANGEEITLSDIYNLIDGDDKKYIQELEKKLEIELTDVCLEMKAVFDKCIELGKRIVICSDMYLDRNTIESILRKNGYSRYEEIFLSSEYKLTKRTGSLFKQMMCRLKVKGNDILHIGDNFWSDYIEAKRQGLEAFHFAPGSRKEMEYAKNMSILYGDMPISFSKKFLWEEIGKYAMGNFLFGYSSWLKKQFESEKYDHIFFLARDGWIVFRAMEIIATEEMKSKFSYLYASRRAFIVPTLHLYRNYEEKCRVMFWNKHFSISEFIANFGLNILDCQETVHKYIEDEKTCFERSDLFSNDILRSIYNDLEDKIIDNSKKEYELLIAYLKQEQFSGKVAIVDIGWFGNLQNALEKCAIAGELRACITGYYVGIRDGSRYLSQQKMKGYLYCGTEQHSNQIAQERTTAIMESFFSKNEGTTIKYSWHDGRIVPVLNERGEDEYKYRILNCIHEVALNRVKKLNGVCSKIGFDNSPEVCFEGFVRIGLQPKLHEAWTVGGFVENVDLYGAMYYFFHPRKIISDIHGVGWKLGQLKRILMVPTDYMKIYDWLD